MHWQRSNLSLMHLVEWAGGVSPRMARGTIESVVFRPQAEASNVQRRSFRQLPGSALRSSGDRYMVPTRGLLTHSAIPRGEVILELPLSRTLHASAAATVLSEWARNAGAEGGPLCKLVGDAVSRPSPQHPSLPFIDTREPLLITAALAVRHRQLGGSSDPRWSPYVSSLPPKVSPVSSAVSTIAHDNGEPAHLAKRLRAGDVSLQLGSSEPTAADKKQLVLAQLKSGMLQDGLVGGESPLSCVEVVPTMALATRFYHGDATPRGRTQPSASTVEVPAFLGHFQHMQRTLQVQLLDRLEAILSHPAGELSGGASRDQVVVDDDDAIGGDYVKSDGSWADCVAWAHFMVRTRAKWLCMHPQLSSRRSCVLSPVSDLFNHDGVHPNVRFVEAPPRGGSSGVVLGHGRLLVVASRPIDAMEELTSDYHDDVYYPDVAESPRTHPSNHDPLMRRIEQEQRYEIVQSAQKEQITNSAAQRNSSGPRSHSRVVDAMKREVASYGTRAFENPEQQNRMLNRRHATSRKDGAVADADWAFRFGFIKCAAEKERDASCMWDGALRDRVARLTDIRRKGQPGEFVVGVPEGLHYLHAERERLQREQYQGKSVFPTQRV